MALFENFPYTNLHELNLDWLIEALNHVKESTVLSVNGETGDVILYEDAQMTLPAVPEDAWTIVRMADGTQRGILFQNNDKAYIIHGNQMGEIYTSGNQPPYPVTRVNGQYGDITLYSDAQVRFPSLTDEDQHNWNIFRYLNNVIRGIQFDDDGTAYIIDGINRYTIYSAHNAPPYPVSSVNGATGAVVLYNDSTGNITFPDYTDPGVTGWNIIRNINNVPFGIIFNTDGTLTFKAGSDEYQIYTSNDIPAGFVEDEDDPVMEVRAPVESGTVWGLLRSTEDGTVGVVFDNDSNLSEPECYIGYLDAQDQLQTVKLLTAADIPPGSVVSVNGLNGVVVLTGSDIEVSSTDSTPIPDALDDIREAMAYYESSNTASQNIPSGAFVFWNGGAYTASQAISASDPLSGSNLTAISSGGFVNAISAGILPTLIKLQTFTKAYSIAANDIGNFTLTDIGLTVPTGYSYAGVINWYTDSNNIYAYKAGDMDMTNPYTLIFRLKNLAVTPVSGTISITVMFIRTDIVDIT